MPAKRMGRVFRKTWRTKKGEERSSEFYYFSVQIKGNRYQGRTPCRNERDAVAWLRTKTEEVLGEVSAKQLVERHRGVLSGRGGLRLDEMWRAYSEKPKKRAMGEARARATKARWDDFLKFVAAKNPAASLAIDIDRPLAEAYISYIRSNGKWDKHVEFRRKRKQKTVAYESSLARLSVNTCNDFLQTCRMVFAYLIEDIGMDNPFAGIDKLVVAKSQAKRQPYTPEQLAQIGAAAKGEVRQLFVAGISTGFREGDICLLERANVDLARGMIERELLKTRVTVRLPIMPGLRAVIEESLTNDETASKYVFPALAKLYLENRTGVSYRVKKLFADLSIDSRRKVAGRDRLVSVLDVHSMRHTFVYLAGLHNIPLPVVQSIVGHMSPEMTKIYMDHATDQDKMTELAKLPDYLSGGNPILEPEDAWRGVSRQVRENIETYAAAIGEDPVYILRGMQAACDRLAMRRDMDRNLIYQACKTIGDLAMGVEP